MNQRVRSDAPDGTPLVTVITPCLNSESTIRDTLQSVAAAASSLAEAGWKLEHWMIDGGSTDGTRDIVSRHCQQHQERGASGYECHWHSRIAKGIYEAMNAGLARASGHFCHIINSDDFILRPADYARLLQAGYHQNALVILSSIIYFSRPGPQWGHEWRLPPLPANQSQWRRQILDGYHYPHPGFIAETKLYRAQGFDERFSVSADYKLMQSLLLRERIYERLISTDLPLIAMAKGGQTGRWPGMLKGYRQLRAINRELGIQANLWKRYSSKLKMRISARRNSL